MDLPTDPRDPSHEGPATGEPLIVPPAVSADVAPPVQPVERVERVEPLGPVEPVEPPPSATDRADESEGGKVKAAALLAGAAALANKVRQEAPKKVHELREKRVAGRCVILTEADGRALTIGPYKNAEAAQEDLFKVGGAPRVVELVSEAAFFAPHDSSRA